jgi:hypothetical protein
MIANRWVRARLVGVGSMVLHQYVPRAGSKMAKSIANNDREGG